MATESGLYDRSGGFHSHTGQNIQFMDKERRTARRIHSFKYGIVFSHRPLRCNEIFTMKIDEQEGGWVGHLRLGLTIFAPTSPELADLPLYAISDLSKVSVGAIDRAATCETQSA